MPLFDGRDIVAAILLYERRALHIREIVDLASEAGVEGLTTLTRKASNPSRMRGSVQSVLSGVATNEIFQGLGGGYYQLRDPNLEANDSIVKAAHDEYRRFRQRLADGQSSVEADEDLRSRFHAVMEQNRQLKEQNRQLEKKLAKITEIATT